MSTERMAGKRKRPTHDDADRTSVRRGPVADDPLVERSYAHDEPAVLAALRVALGLPLVPVKEDRADERPSPRPRS